ncbi:MAG: hypothetical protein ACK4FJ_15935 [Ferrovibrio sp.]|uniref:hypothetical protein n=1 Tax=Ferrovibrio sp. TaxID=1917215 RepID=UPI00391D7012
MTHRNGIPKRQAGRRLVALVAAIGLLAASLLMPPAMAAVSGGIMPSSVPQTEMQAGMQAGHDHAGHSHAIQGHADRHDHDGQMPQSNSYDRSGNPSDDPGGCGLCSDCVLCTMTIPITVGALPVAEYPPVRLSITNTSLLPGIAPPPPAEPPRV